MNRRTFMKGSIAASAVAVAAGAGLLQPGRVLAAGWPQTAFSATSIDDGLKTLFGAAGHSVSDKITIKAPLQAENGAIVPFSVSTSLPEVKAIGVFVQNNAQPLIASAELATAGGFLSARMKMAKSSDVYAVVNSGGKLYSAKKMIKVTVGGCGG
jgi:sulfur-oxidizing protein SoxY